MLDSADGICAWMLFSSGSTPWSGDDWRKSPQYIIFLGKPPHSSIDTWSAADVQGAVAAVPHRIEKGRFGWSGCGSGRLDCRWSLK